MLSEDYMSSSNQTERGFSLLELLIAMVVTLTLMTAGTTLLTSALRTRSRENQKSDALADTQRALNIMSREIADTGFNVNGNGLWTQTQESMKYASAQT